MVGTSLQSRMPMTGASRRPDHRRHASSRAWSTFGAAGRGRRAWLRRNGRAAGMPRKSSVSASLYAEPAGVSALYSVIRSRPSAGSKKASSRDTGLAGMRGSSSASARSSSLRRNWSRTRGFASAARSALSSAPSSTATRARSRSYCAGERNRGRSTVQSGRSPKKSPRRSSWPVSHSHDSAASAGVRPSCHAAIAGSVPPPLGATPAQAPFFGAAALAGRFAAGFAAGFAAVFRPLRKPSHDGRGFSGAVLASRIAMSAMWLTTHSK